MRIIDAGRIEQRTRLLAALNEDPHLEQAIAAMEHALRTGHKVLAFGNGGSATQSSHFAAEMVNKFYFRRQALPVLALSSDMANITAIANDEDFRFIFSKQLEAFGAGGDVALGITTSGRSANVLQALSTARERGLLTIALAGRHIDALRSIPADIVVSVAADDTPTIQEMHLFMLHAIAETIEKKIFGGTHV